MSSAKIIFLAERNGRAQRDNAISPAQPSDRFAEFNAIQPGDEARLSKRITAEDIEAFARLSGDRNPLHMDDSFAGRTRFQKRVVHGMLLGSYISTLVGMHCPGPGALWTQQSFRWPAPVFIGDQIDIKLKVMHKSSGSRMLTIEVKAVNGNGDVVMEGEGAVSVLEERRPEQHVPITQRVAFVSGASRGIGGAIASALARAGAGVAINCRHSAGEADGLCAEIQTNGGRAIVTRSDVTDQQLVATAVQKAESAFGKPVDILVNTVGTTPVPQPFMETTWDDVVASLEMNLKGTYNCCHAVIPGMVAQKSGRIINISSVLTRGTPPPNWSAFLMAKAALETLTRCLAAELGPQGVRANIVSPGLVETGAITGVPERLRKLQAMQTPLRRFCTPEDVAAAVLALCTDAGEFITGADIPVCGGFRM